MLLTHRSSLRVSCVLNFCKGISSTTSSIHNPFPCCWAEARQYVTSIMLCNHWLLQTDYITFSSESRSHVPRDPACKKEIKKKMATVQITYFLATPIGGSNGGALVHLFSTSEKFTKIIVWRPQHLGLPPPLGNLRSATGPATDFSDIPR